MNRTYVKHDEFTDRQLGQISAMIRQRREELGWSQGDLATAAGMIRSHVARIESGRANYTVSILFVMFRALGIQSLNIE